MSPTRACAPLLLLVVACAAPLDGALLERPPDDTAGEPAASGGLVLGELQVCADAGARDTPLFVPPDPGDFPTTQTPGSITAPTGWGATVEDFDGDGHLDVVLSDYGAPKLYRGDGTGRLDLVDAAFVGTDTLYAYGASAADVDADGDLDLHVARLGADVLWINDGTGHFTDGTAAAGLGEDPYDSVHSAWGDYDCDGDLDLYVATYWTEALHPNGAEKGWVGDPNMLWENDGAGRFVDRSHLIAFRSGSIGFTLSGGWWDVDGDRRPELHVVNDKGYLGYANALARYDGAAFTDVSEGSGLDIVVQGMGLGAADLNGDSVPDFLVTDWAELWLLMSDGAGGWYDAALARGLHLPLDDNRIVAWGTELADLDNDGDDDAFVTFGNDDLLRDTRNEHGVVSPLLQSDGVWLQGEDGQFEQVGDQWGVDTPTVGRGFALADLDGNGWLDLVRRDLVGVARVDLQACGSAGWLRISLAGPAPNPYGVGARVEVEADGRRWIRWIHAGSTNLSSSSPLEAHFGLGEVDRVDTLRVVWPDGAVQAFTDIDTRRRVTVRRDAH